MKKIFMILSIISLIACKENENTAEYQLKRAAEDAKTAEYFLKNIKDNPTYGDSVNFYVNEGFEHCKKAELLNAKGL